MKEVSDKVLITGIVSSMFFWGLSWPSTKVLTHYCSAVNFAVYRYFIVVATLIPILLLLKVSIIVRKPGIPAVMVSGVLLAVYTWFFFQGLKFGAAGAGGVLSTTFSPIIAYFIGIIMNKKLPSRNESVGLILGLVAGSFLLKLWGNSRNIFEYGNLYFLLAATTWAVMSKITSGGGKNGSPLGFSFWQYLVTLLCLLPMMDTHEFQKVFQVRDALFWANLLFSSVVVTSIATTIFFYATTRLGAEKASSFMFMVPLSAAMSSWLFLGEKILPHTIIGGALGIIAVYFINKRRKIKHA